MRAAKELRAKVNREESFVEEREESQIEVWKGKKAERSCCERLLSIPLVSHLVRPSLKWWPLAESLVSDSRNLSRSLIRLV